MIKPVIITKEKVIWQEIVGNRRNALKDRGQLRKDKGVVTTRETSLDHRKAAADRRSNVFNRLHGTERSGMFEFEGRC